MLLKIKGKTVTMWGTHNHGSLLASRSNGRTPFPLSGPDLNPTCPLTPGVLPSYAGVPSPGRNSLVTSAAHLPETRE